MRRTIKKANRPVSHAWAIKYDADRVLEIADLMDAVVTMANTEDISDPVDPAIIHVIEHFVARAAEDLRREANNTKRLADQWEAEEEARASSADEAETEADSPSADELVSIYEQLSKDDKATIFHRARRLLPEALSASK